MAYQSYQFTSSGENWHRIIRTGLVAASGTSLQIHGAAYGPGVYLSPQCQLSLGYSKWGQGATSTRALQNVVCGNFDIICGQLAR